MFVEYKFLPYVSAQNNDARPLIISVNNCIYATLGIYHSVWMNFIPPCKPDSRPHTQWQIASVA